jgi:spoIIIJ-associated protein
MDFVEVEGKTVEDAIKKALEMLSVSREKVTIHVVSEGKQGLFGMKGAKPAKVRVSIKN